ncbi:MAG: hypothetical protein ACFBZ8_06605 [Opitutales bacterium]
MLLPLWFPKLSARALLSVLLLTPISLTAEPQPLAPVTLPQTEPSAFPAGKAVFQEQDGLLVIEAEHFAAQAQTEKRRWYLFNEQVSPDISPDADPPHLEDAGGEAYLEILPDTRVTHADPMRFGTNFANAPGRLAILTYLAEFTQPGRYYVWVRAHSTGTEDNGIHVGLNGAWPESGRRMQWCEGKRRWWWESKQRTEEKHCGVPGAIFLEIEEPGLHRIHFSMREDGFEFDRFLLTTDADFPRPADVGPPESPSVIPTSDPAIAATR